MLDRYIWHGGNKRNVWIQGGGSNSSRVWEKLKEYFPETDTAARVSADTYGIFILLKDPVTNASKIYSKLLDLKEQTFIVNKEAISVSINASICFYPDDGKDVQTLYQKADITLKGAKKEGSGVINEKTLKAKWHGYTLVKKAVKERLFITTQIQ